MYLLMRKLAWNNGYYLPLYANSESRRTKRASPLTSAFVEVLTEFHVKAKTDPSATISYFEIIHGIGKKLSGTQYTSKIVPQFSTLKLINVEKPISL